jgi:integrase
MLPEPTREFFLDAAQMRQLLQALAGDRDKVAAAAIALMLLTGARRSEILQARWEYVDVGRQVLQVPRAKSGRRHFVVLSDAAVRLLQMQPRAEGQAHVFPAPRAADWPIASVRTA